MRRSTIGFLTSGFLLYLGGCSSGNQGAANGTGSTGVGSSAATNGSGRGGAGGRGSGTSTDGNATGSTSTGSTSPGAGGTPPSCRTCAADNCGLIDDGCGVLLDCGTCKSGICGATIPSVCSTCTAVTCASASANCGPMSDGCGKLLDCGTCGANEACGTAGPNHCGPKPIDPTVCLNFCPQQVACPTGGTTTTITGTVYAPSGYPALKPARGEASLPLPNAIVYVPNASTTFPYGLSPFKDGVAGGACSCEVEGSPLVSAQSGVDGSFTLTNVPAGTDIPLVIQLGRWRRLITIPTVTACQTTTLAPELTRLPRTQGEGNAMDSIPLMALTTGAVDALECVFRKMGVEDSQFSNAGGTGRIQFYKDNGAICTTGGGSCTGNTPGYHTLTASQANVDKYDALIYPCDGGAHDEPGAEKSRVLDAPTNGASYVNKGGRAFFTHFSYAWLYNQQPSIQLPWPSTTNSQAVNTQWTTAYGEIDTSFARGATFAKWLGLPLVGALTGSTPVPYITVDEVRRDLANPTNWPNGLPADRWIYSYNNPSYRPSDAIQHISFDTPWGLPKAQQCGRVLFSSFHVTTAAIGGATTGGNSPKTTDMPFPSECNSTFSAQEKVLAYMLFDMTSCVQPPPTACVPLTCSNQKAQCGQAGDGCGGVIDCGPCCKPYDCAGSGHNSPLPDASLNCNFPDGCGGLLSCGCDVG